MNNDESVSLLGQINDSLSVIKSLLAIIAGATTVIAFAVMKASGWWNLF